MVIFHSYVSLPEGIWNSYFMACGWLESKKKSMIHNSYWSHLISQWNFISRSAQDITNSIAAGWLSMGLPGWWFPTWPWWFDYLPSGKHTENYGKSSFLMGKLTISMAIFNSYVSHYQRVKNVKNTMVVSSMWSTSPERNFLDLRRLGPSRNQ